MTEGDLNTRLQSSLDDPADRQTTQIVRGVEIGDQRLQRGGAVARRRRDVFDDRIEQRGEIVALAGDPHPFHRPARAGDRGDDRELDVESDASRSKNSW